MSSNNDNSILGIADSINDVPIRLTLERWEHILERHAEFSYNDYVIVLDCIYAPEYILRGYGGSLIAVMQLGNAGFLHVVYRELSPLDGFIITARIADEFDRRLVIWRRDDPDN